MLVLTTITGFQGEQYDESGWRIYVDEQMKRDLAAFLVPSRDDEKHVMGHLFSPDEKVLCEVNVLAENRPSTPTRYLRVQIELFDDNGQYLGSEAAQHFRDRSELIVGKIKEYLPKTQVLLVM